MAYLVIFLILFLLYVFAVSGRRDHPELCKLRGWKYAHRGLHGAGAPENSLEAFQRAVNAGYGAELDVHLLSDGELAVIHDSLLQRTTGQSGRVEDLTASQLCNYHLDGTQYTIPLFKDVLDVFAGRTPLIVELKAVNGNVNDLCSRTCAILDNYEGVYCVESFDPRCIRWMRKNRPDIIRGQLSENYFRYSSSKIPAIIKFVMKHQMLNFWTRPDFIAYRFCDRKILGNLICRKLWKLQGVTWTLQNQEEFDTAASEGWIPIFEGFLP